MVVANLKISTARLFEAEVVLGAVPLAAALIVATFRGSSACLEAYAFVTVANFVLVAVGVALAVVAIGTEASSADLAALAIRVVGAGIIGNTLVDTLVAEFPCATIRGRDAGVVSGTSVASANLVTDTFSGGSAVVVALTDDVELADFPRQAVSHCCA